MAKLAKVREVSEVREVSGDFYLSFRLEDDAQVPVLENAGIVDPRRRLVFIERAARGDEANITNFANFANFAKLQLTHSSSES